MTPRKAYKQTNVPVSRTQEAVRKLLIKYDVMGCQFTENFETNEIVLRFVKRIDEIPRTVKISLTAEKNEKQAYRALYYWIKSQLEAVDFGLVSFENVFLAHFEWMLEDGTATTVGEIVLPQLGQQGQGRLLEGPKEDVVEGTWEVSE